MWLGAVALGGFLAVGLIAFVYVLLRLREEQQRVREKEAEHQGMLDRLQENENRLRAIIESEPECVKLQAADGTVLEINPAGLALVGAERPEDIIGRKIFTVVAPEYRDYYRENMRRVFEGESVVYEFKSITLKGRTAWMESHAVPLRDARGNIYALLGITRDITEHKWAEEQARRHQTELARVARLSTMGEMATGIAHELNQPLTALSAYGTACEELLARGDTGESLKNAIRLMVSESFRAAEVVRRLRDFFRTGDTRLVAQAELIRCALQVASLGFDDCPGFRPLAQDAGPAARAYAAYLAADWQGLDVALLPASHRAVVAQHVAGSAQAAQAARRAHPATPPPPTSPRPPPPGPCAPASGATARARSTSARPPRWSATRWTASTSTARATRSGSSISSAPAAQPTRR